MCSRLAVKLAFYGADTDTDILATILARMSVRMSACPICFCFGVQLATGITSGNRVGEDPCEDVGVRVSVGVVECQLY